MSQVLKTCADGSAVAVLIVGIDPGTTGAKVAFLRAFETYNSDKIELTVDPHDRIHVIGCFPGYRQSYVTTLPTCLVYDYSGNLVQWGHHAVNIQSKTSFDPRFLIENWKIKLLEGSMQNQLGKPPQAFTTDFFRALIDHLFNGPRSALLGHFGASDKMAQFAYIDISIAMPAGWSHEEHTLFTDAAKKALQGVPKARISMVSETECALRSWQSQQGKYDKIKEGEVVILMDLGGGTACLSSFLYEGERWAHLESLRAGSEVAAVAFQREFIARLKLAQIPETSRILYRALKEFAVRKMEIGTDDEEDFWLCPVEGLKHSEQFAFRDGEMFFTREQLWGYFQPLQEEILEKLDDIVARTKPKYCVLVGAYARNDLFLKMLEKENERYKMELLSPENQAEVVASGACYTRVEGDIRLVHESKISVGIVTFKPWNEIKAETPDAYHFRLHGDRRTWYCRVITWIVKKGDMADPNTAIIDHDGNDLRRRYLQSKNDLIINEVVLTIEADPNQNKKHTVLRYGTDDDGWQKNKRDFREKFGVSLNVRSFELDLTHMLINSKNTSKIDMQSASFKCDAIGRYFEYKYYLNLTQTDCRISLQVFSQTGYTGRMLLQHSIPAYEVESKELQDEQRFASQLSKRQRTGQAPKKRNIGGVNKTPNRRSPRARVKNKKNLSSAYISKETQGGERESDLEQGTFLSPAADETFHHLERFLNMSPPAPKDGQVVSSDVPMLQEYQPNDEDVILLDSETESWKIAQEALNYLSWPNPEDGSPCVSGGFHTPNTGRARRIVSAPMNTPNSDYVAVAPDIYDIGTLQGISIPQDDVNDLDYDVSQDFNREATTVLGANDDQPGRKYPKKHTTLSSKRFGAKSKKTSA